MKHILSEGEQTLDLQIPKLKRSNKRAEIIGELFELHNGDKLGIKKANWKRYIQWLKDKQLPNSPANQIKFSKSKMFIKPLEIRGFCSQMAHVKTDDLPYVLSVAKDKKHRQQGVAGYIRSLFPKKLST